MRYAQPDWERERSGWRAVVQLNIVRSIITILGVVEAELSGETSDFSDDSDVPESSTTPIKHNNGHVPIAKFTDRHQLLMIRLAPLRGVEADLKRRLGAGTEPTQPSLPLAATPFDTPSKDPAVKRSPLEFSVRCWNDVVDPESRMGHEEGDANLDMSTITISGCKNDMKALWTDKSVQTVLARRKVRLPDSAAL